VKPTEDQTGLKQPDPATHRLAVLGAVASACALGAGVFYFFAVARFGLDVPVEDDVEFLRFLLERGRAGGEGWFAFHNEHRPAVARAIFAATAAVQGQLDFRTVMFVGNAALAGLAVLVCTWLPKGPALHRLAAAAPVVVLLFSLQHWQAATWATGAAQHYPMLLCALGSITLLAKPTLARLLAGGLLAAGALFNLGAGLFAFVVGGALLLQARAWRMAAAFGAWSALCIGFYFWGYARPDHHPSPFAALAQPVAAFDYACSLLGAGLSFDDARTGWLARFAGLGMGFAFAIQFRDRRSREHDNQVLASLCLVGLSLASITATRFGFGLDQAFDSRYRVYSHLFMALLWISFVRRRVASTDHGYAPIFAPVIGALCFTLAINAASVPSAWARMNEHRSFYAENIRQWAQGRTLIPGPAVYSRIVESALDEGLYVFPCDAVGVEPSDDNRFCPRTGP